MSDCEKASAASRLRSAGRLNQTVTESDFKFKRFSTILSDYRAAGKHAASEGIPWYGALRKSLSLGKLAGKKSRKPPLSLRQAVRLNRVKKSLLRNNFDLSIKRPEKGIGGNPRKRQTGARRHVPALAGCQCVTVHWVNTHAD